MVGAAATGLLTTAWGVLLGVDLTSGVVAGAFAAKLNAHNVEAAKVPISFKVMLFMGLGSVQLLSSIWHQC